MDFLLWLEERIDMRPVGESTRRQHKVMLSCLREFGYGLRKLKRWQDVTGRPMYIETTINSVKVTFDLQTRGANVAKNVAKNLTDRQQQIIALITDNPQTTRAEIANALGVATKTIERELAAISDIIRYVGSKKGGHWEIIK